MNIDKKIKMLLLKLGKQGHDVSLIKDIRYSKEFGNLYNRYKLTFWHKEIKVNKRTGVEKLVSVPDTHDFKKAAELLQYMVVIVNANNREAEGIC